MKIYIISIFLLIITSSCLTQKQIEYKLVGGPCEGCEAVFEFGNKSLSSIDTIPGFRKANQKLIISGKVYKSDETTPAENVIMYFYQTNEAGLYKPNKNESGLGLRHGSNRTWLKTDKEGNYKLYTFKPGVYPNRIEPSHIHLTILESNGKYYYVQDYLFEGDSLLTEKHLSQNTFRGTNNGILKLSEENKILTGERNIILGKNISDYSR